ncbi:MAG: glycosyltransferase family 39 protein [Bacteroidota bacterium]|jgi:4-amino-4-deoxy-L-arabinose transferase-like glycosyltransferase
MKRSCVIILIFVLAKFLLQLAALLQPAYGIFRDELYYLACAKHLAWGFVDHPPFSIAVLWVWVSAAGDSLVSLRILAALVGTLPVAMTGLITRKLGGEWKAQALACFAVLLAPIQIGISSFYSMNVIEYALIPLLVLLLLRIIMEQKTSLWILFGVFMGIGIINKHTFAVLAGFMLIGLLFTPARKEFLKKHFWIGMGTAFLIVLPNLIWQFSHNFISLEFYKNASELKNVPTPPLKIVFDQLLSSNPIAGILWVTGLVWLLRGKERGEYRMFGIAFLLMLAMMITAQSNRLDRIALFIPVLVAGGAVVWERWNAKRFLRWLIPVTAILLLIGGLVSLPMVLPIMSPSSTAQYLHQHGMQTNFEKGISAELPQNLADRFGWKELADSVNAVIQRLPERESGSVLLAGENYGDAGALEYYERSLNFPQVISGHNSYWLWGAGKKAEVLIMVGNPRSRMEELFNDVQEGTRTSTGWQMNYECNRPIWLCRKPKMPLTEIWPKAKKFI